MAGEDPEEEAEEDEKCYEAAEVFFDNHGCQLVHCAGIFIHIYL